MNFLCKETRKRMIKYHSFFFGRWIRDVSNLNAGRSRNLFSERSEVIDLLKPLCKTEIFNRNQNFSSCTFASPISQQAIDGLLNQGTIFGVPVDTRYSAKDQLKRSLRTPRNHDRIPFVCCSGSAGSGKSVLQGFNMHWFREFMQQGGHQCIALHVTFDDDQGALWKNVTGRDEFKKALALRVIHRVIQPFLKDPSQGTIIFINSSIERAILDLYWSDYGLHFVRELLNAPEDTPILLCVDDLAKANAKPKVKPTHNHVGYLMEGLANHMDYYDRNLYLSLVSEDSSELSTFIGRRVILMQSLPPISPLHPSVSTSLLPPMVQVFHNESLRKRLPDGAVNQALYSRVAQLLNTGFHPGHLNELFAKFQDLRVDLDDDFDPTAFVKKLSEWLEKYFPNGTQEHQLQQQQLQIPKEEELQ